MLDIGSREHAFGTMNVKIDPNRVVNSIKEDIRKKNYKEVTIMSSEQSDSFTPMQWPLFDDGKPIGTNAMGYEVGGYFKRHQDALRMAQAEADIKEEEQRVVKARDAAMGITSTPTSVDDDEYIDMPSVTVEELEAIRNAARKEGYTEGLRQGHSEGFDKGMEQGRAEGYVKGRGEGQEQGYQDGFRAGRDEGFAKGQEAGIASGSDIVTTQADRFRHLADMLANPIREVDEQVTDEIVYIISRLAKVILRRELKEDPEFIKGSIEKALTLIPDANNNSEIILSEHDYALMVAAIGRDYMNEQGWNIKSSETMDDGDIQIHTPVSSVQWRVNDRIDALLNDFLVAAADAVTSARRESIEGGPEFDEVPKRSVIPPRDILSMKEDIEKNIAQMAPPPDYANRFPELVLDTPQEEEPAGFDPDDEERQAAALHEQRQAEIMAKSNTTEPQAQAIGSDEVIEAQPLTPQESMQMQEQQVAQIQEQDLQQHMQQQQQ